MTDNSQTLELEPDIEQAEDQIDFERYDPDPRSCLDEIREQELACKRCEKLIERLKGDLKKAKADLEVETAELRRLSDYQQVIEDINEERREEAIRQRQREQEQSERAAANDAAGSESEREETQAELLKRLSGVPITELNLDTVPKLGGKKRDALLEHVPNLGKLEQLRIEASLECLPLHKLLPAGIGAAIADELVERLLGWHMSQSNAMHEGDAANEEGEPSDAGSVQGEDQPSVPGVDASKEEHEAYLLKRSIELQADEVDLESYRGREGFESGCDAHSQGWELGSCPRTPGEGQDAWIAGYLISQELADPDEDDDLESGDDIEMAETTPAGEWADL